MVWHAVILAAGRGMDDPMAKAFGVAHKCMIPVNGVPMLAHVLRTLAGTRVAPPITVSIDNLKVAAGIQGNFVQRISIGSAPASALDAINHINVFPVLITTGDHPLLTTEMVEHVLRAAETSGADVLVGLATSEVVLAAYPENRRTWFNLGGTRVSGCNLFAVMNDSGLKLLEAWQALEKNRKNPLKLVAAFGVKPLLLFALGRLTPQRAFNHVSQKLGISVKPVFLPFAEAAIDVDKPTDHALAEEILQRRAGSGPA